MYVGNHATWEMHNSLIIVLNAEMGGNTKTFPISFPANELHKFIYGVGITSSVPKLETW